MANDATTSAGDASGAGGMLDDRWPALARTMQDYKRQVADDFTQLAYRQIEGGVIRYDDRRRLAKAAHRAGIRPFDAQILIACAVRQWSLDQTRGSAVKAGRVGAGKGRAEGGLRSGIWWAVAAVVALLLDAVIIGRCF